MIDDLKWAGLDTMIRIIDTIREERTLPDFQRYADLLAKFLSYLRMSYICI